MDDSTTNGTSVFHTHVFSYTDADAGTLLGETLNSATFLNMPSVTDMKRKSEIESKSSYVRICLKLKRG